MESCVWDEALPVGAGLEPEMAIHRQVFLSEVSVLSAWPEAWKWWVTKAL